MMNQPSQLRSCTLALAALLVGQLPQAPIAAGNSSEEDAAWPRHTIDDSLRGADGVKLADFDGDGRLDIVTGWEEGGQTRVYLHPGTAEVRRAWPAVTIGKTPNVEDALPVDLDGDGVLDVLSLCEGRTQSIFVHWGPPSGKAAALLEAGAGQQERLTPPLPEMMWMFAAVAEARDDETTVVAAGKGESALVGRILVKHVQTGDTRLPDVRWQPLSPVGWIMSIVLVDMDGDGDEDVLLSDRRGPLRGVRWLENPRPQAPSAEDESGEWNNHFVGGRDREVMFLTTADWDADGLQDILVAAKPANLVWHRRLDARGDKWESTEIPYPPASGTAKAVAVGDLDGNGVSDLVVTCEAASGDKSGVWWLARNDPEETTGVWHDVSGPDGIKYDLVELIDLDADGDLDVLTCEEAWQGRGLGVVWYENLFD